MIYYHRQENIVPNKPFRVMSKDKDGKPTGEYTGYYYAERGIVKLYPAKGSWIYGKLKVHEISVYILRRM